MQPATLNRQQCRELDRRAVEEYGMSSLVLMENAGRGVADFLCQRGEPGSVAICCGRGNNAGDGFVIARHLDLRGWDVAVLLFAAPQQLKGDALANYQVLLKSGVAITDASLQPDATSVAKRLASAAWIVDALLGTGSAGDPRPPLPTAIDLINRQPGSILSVDVPSGLDCDTGLPSSHTIRAKHTCTFVAQKPGFLVPEARPFLGEVHVLDIGAPRALVEAMTAPRA